jgi:hypothetical protein
MHYVSPSRLETFELAEKHYEAAESALRALELDLPSLTNAFSSMPGGFCSERVNGHGNGGHANEEMPVLENVVSLAHSEQSDRETEVQSSMNFEHSRDFSFFLQSLVANRFCDNLEELKLMIRGYLLEIPILKAQGDDASLSPLRSHRGEDSRTHSSKCSSSQLKPKPSYDLIGSTNVRSTVKEEKVRRWMTVERPRRRFDSKRYQELCEKALAELPTSGF